MFQQMELKLGSNNLCSILEMVFFSITAAIAEKEEQLAMYIGVVQEDSSGYPDCTDHLYLIWKKAINQGTKEDTHIDIITPLVHLSKAPNCKKQ